MTKVIAPPVEKTRFDWVSTDEPHASRRMEILKKFPEIKKLMGHDWTSKYICIGLVSGQVAAAYLLNGAAWYWIVLVAYCFGAVCNHALQLAIHELSHNLMFKKPLHNQLFGMFANLPMVVAAAITFKKYHLEHHKFQGVEGVDVDLPTEWEGRVFRGPVMKTIWVFLQGFFYAFRPMLVRPKRAGWMEALNWVVMLSFDAALVFAIGWDAITYLLLSDLFGLGLHPVAGHFIAEHYCFTKGAETYSYYGSMRRVIFNVGFHNEHHDFPNIPGSRLSEVNRIANEFYRDLPCHTSYCKVIWDYITDPSMGPFARVKRTATPQQLAGDATMPAAVEQ
jgi:sphingolipid delta-4 desaturase